MNSTKQISNLQPGLLAKSWSQNKYHTHTFIWEAAPLSVIATTPPHNWTPPPLREAESLEQPILVVILVDRDRKVFTCEWNKRKSHTCTQNWHSVMRFELLVCTLFSSGKPPSFPLHTSLSSVPRILKHWGYKDIQNRFVPALEVWFLERCLFVQKKKVYIKSNRKSISFKFEPDFWAKAASKSTQCEFSRFINWKSII